MRNFIELFLTSFGKCNLLSVNIFSLGLDMLLTNPVLAKKKGNYNSAHKNSRKVWKIVGFINSSKST